LKKLQAVFLNSHFMNVKRILYAAQKLETQADGETRRRTENPQLHRYKILEDLSTAEEK
jgi:hypothetical protein